MQTKVIINRRNPPIDAPMIRGRFDGEDWLADTDIDDVNAGSHLLLVEEKV